MEPDQIISKLAELREKVTSTLNKQAEATARKAVLEAKRAELADKLFKLVGDADWAAVSQHIGLAAQAAQEAVEKLTAALKDAGVDYE